MLCKSIRYYRLQKGLSQEELATLLGMTKMAISHYESGNRTPDLETAKRLAEALGISLGRLYAYKESDVVLVGVHFRKGDDLTESGKEAVTAKMLRSVSSYIDAASYLGFNIGSVDFPEQAIPAKGTPDECAAYMREVLGLASSGPICNLVQHLENRGVYIVELGDGAYGKASGCSGRASAGFPVIAVDKEATEERLRFTLAHELAHLLFEGSSDHREKDIDDIAGRFLVPRGDLLRELGAKIENLGLSDIHFVHDEYGVSAQCVMTRLRQERIINEQTYKDFKNCSLKTSFSQREAPTRLKQLVCRAYNEGEIGVSKAAELMDVPYSEAYELCCGEWPQNIGGKNG